MLLFPFPEGPLSCPVLLFTFQKTGLVLTALSDNLTRPTTLIPHTWGAPGLRRALADETVFLLLPPAARAGVVGTNSDKGERMNTHEKCAAS